jgi:acyl carrier protein
VERFIRTRFRVLDWDHRFHRDAHLYESGFVDSAGIVELIAFLESTFTIELRHQDLVTDAFTTINGISGVVHTHLNGAGSDGRG